MNMSETKNFEFKISGLISIRSRKRIAEARSLKVRFLLTPPTVPLTVYVPQEFLVIDAISLPLFHVKILDRFGPIFGHFWATFGPIDRRKCGFM
jgi:hypothetical protein